jgi:hypothetical protein
MSGELVRHTCDPDQLGTYFDDADAPSRPHYLTPVYFRLEVLGRYVSEPRRYHVTRTRLACLNLWGTDAVRNTEDLVEVYLGDIGKKIPRAERPHWLSFNVAPRGEMDEGRFRRDILNQPASTSDPVGSLLRVIATVDERCTELWGQPLRTPLTEPLRTEFEHLYGPVVDDPSALIQPVLTLTKGLVDSLSLPFLRSHSAEQDRSVKSIQLLRRWAEAEGWDADAIVTPLTDLQAIRAKGQAHRSDTSRWQLFNRLGLDALSTPAQFDAISEMVGAALEELLRYLDP